MAGVPRYRSMCNAFDSTAVCVVMCAICKRDRIIVGCTVAEKRTNINLFLLIYAEVVSPRIFVLVFKREIFFKNVSSYFIFNTRNLNI